MQARALFRELWREWEADRLTDVAAMMTYYAIFAMFPMLVFVVTIALIVVPAEWIGVGVDMMVATVPAEVGTLLRDQVGRMQSAAGAGFAIGSALLALWGASRGAAALIVALDDVFEKKETRSWWRRQATAIATTLAVALLLVAAMALLTLGPAAGHAVADRVGWGSGFELVWGVSRWLLAAFLVMLTWAILYKWLPDTDAPFRIFTPGAIVGVILWFLVTQGFGFYLDRFASYEKTYGSIASVIVFLFWIWLSNLALLIGAEINDVLAELRKHDSPAAAKLARREKAPDEKPISPER
ncbi:MAG: YihY/virulence factor BrkB family protein [Kofleriaceae bacterium]|nr:MAG: YihY/virulence factor BrkB family protein [Kofleriaceae bacterium]MBZ0236985.1 YihY/virulence factor BrkB family protein [Kofleriaceae bacterium]